MSNRIPNLIIDDAELLFPNFAGREKRFNEEGQRNFCVVLDEDQFDIDAMRADGWNIKMLKPRDEMEKPKYYVQVKVDFEHMYPPKVILVCGNRQTPMDEDSIGTLDFADIIKADVAIRPRVWDGGIKGYLKSLWVTIEEDPFAHKYGHIRDDD